jgi:hypothetical protein
MQCQLKLCMNRSLPGQITLRHPMQRFQTLVPSLLISIAAIMLLSNPLSAQQTLGGITGEVTDASGGVIPNVTVTVTDEHTALTRSTTTSNAGTYTFVNLPIGTYTITYTASGYEVQKTPHITVQADRTATLNASLKVGQQTTTIEVEGSPMMNAVDTTNGYVMETSQIAATPLPTGSFTGLAIESTGVDAELSGGTGANSGLGNAPIWANGQRDTSNSFLLNGVDATNLFNGKSTSQVDSSRVINSTGVQTQVGGGGGVIMSVASIYLSIGNAIPTPAPESLQEVRVNASMYTADQGSTSGAHIDMSTKSGTNDLHGAVYAHRGTDWINAAPFFFNQDPDVPAGLKRPQLHRYILGGTFGGPIIKDKLFGFVSFQHLHVSDQELGDGFLTVPVGLNDNNRDPGDLASLTNTSFGTTLTGASMNSLALELFNSPALPGEPGKWLIPNDARNGTPPTAARIDNAFIPGTGYFTSDQAVADMDYNATSKDTLALKYYYQHDPTIAPYSYSSVPGFTQHLDSGSQEFSINNSLILKSNLSTTETIGVLREKNWSDNSQAFGPTSIPGGSYGTGSINAFSPYFPGISIVNVLGNYQPTGVSPVFLNIGPNAESQSANTGMFQNRLEPSGNAIWILGKHTLNFGATYSYTQLNTIDKRTGTGTITSDDLSEFMQGYDLPGSAATEFYVTSYLQGNANRYYRANQLGMYITDKYQVTPTLALNIGLRYDWDGGLTEKYGRIFNFDPGTNPQSCSPSTSDPNAYSYCATSDTIANPGLIIAGNNANGSKGVSNTTLTGRQWGIAPRFGAAWQPAMFHSKLVVRTGAGFYYDRGELFTYFSPGYAIGTVTGGPFGVNQQLPFVNTSTCPSSSLFYYEGYLPTCGGGGGGAGGPASEGNIENPYGTSVQAPPSNPKASDLANYLPNACSIVNTGYSGVPGLCSNTPNGGEIVNNGQPISLGVYDRANKLPYTINYTLDLQWQPRSDLAVGVGYVGNVGRHQVIPVPFNQPNIASPTNQILAGGGCPQAYTYGYNVNFYGPLPASAPSCFGSSPSYLGTYEGGNVDLRVPYIGYAAESIDYKAAGIDDYNALQVHVDKRMSHDFQVGASYTYSHALDEQSGLGLFYWGNNPLNLRSSYGSSDFDRKNVLNFNYVFQLPKLRTAGTLAGKFVNGWSLVGLTVLQGGQPYSVIDFSGAIGSIYYSTSDGITNPVVPLAPGCTAKKAMTGASGAWVLGGGKPALNAACFTLPLLTPGSLNGAIPANDPYETTFTTGQRNIFRQAFQKRADASLVKVTSFDKERYSLKYTFDVYNLTNTTSFDIPGNQVSQNAGYNNFPTPGAPATGAPCGPSSPPSCINPLYSAPGGLGIVSHTIGSPRQIQMSLHFDF